MKKNMGNIALAIGAASFNSYKVGLVNGQGDISETTVNQIIGFTNATHS